MLKGSGRVCFRMHPGQKSISLWHHKSQGLQRHGLPMHFGQRDILLWSHTSQALHRRGLTSMVGLMMGLAMRSGLVEGGGRDLGVLFVWCP